MFIGHFAVGFGAKRAVPAVSLGSLFLACELADLLWPNFVLLGLEKVEIDPGNTADRLDRALVAGRPAAAGRHQAQAHHTTTTKPASATGRLIIL